MNISKKSPEILLISKENVYFWSIDLNLFLQYRLNSINFHTHSDIRFSHCNFDIILRSFSSTSKELINVTIPKRKNT